MIVGDLTALKIMAVLDRGIPNEECIAIQAQEKINLGQFGIMLGVYSEPNSAFPIKDNLFWFGDGVVNNGDWVFIQTGSGEPRKTKAKNGENDIYTIFWGRKNTVFAKTDVVPLLFKVDKIDVLSPPEDLPQIEDRNNHLIE